MNKLKFTIQCLIMGCIVLSSLKIQAQTVTVPKLEWANGLTGDGKILTPMFMDKDNHGDIVTISDFSATIDFDPSQSTYNITSPLIGGFYIWKCDNAGNFLWVKTVGTDMFSLLASGAIFIRSMTVDKDNGDIYITGTYADSTIDFDPGPGVYRMIPAIEEGWGIFASTEFILKLNSTGEFQWAKSLDIYNGGGIRRVAIGTNQGEKKHIYFSGASTPLVDFVNGGIRPFDFDPGPDTAFIYPLGYSGHVGYLICLDDNGDFIWVKAISESSSFSSFGIGQMLTDNKGDIYISGTFTGTIDVNPSPAVYNLALLI